jgi:micrococcal nuclease
MTRLPRRITPYFFAVLMGIIISIFSGTQHYQIPRTTTPKAAERVTPSTLGVSLTRVTKVIDGDTFQIETGQKVRMIGMDTPELHHPKKPVQCFGKEAMEKTKQLIEGKIVRLEKDISETDRYGRLLRYVYLENLSPTPIASQSAELFVNAYLVQQGYAHVLTVPPDVAKSKEFLQLQEQAMQNRVGLWKSCNL